MTESFPFDRLRACTNFRAGDLLPSCGAVNAKELATALKEGIEARGLPLKFEKVHCMGRCHLGPTLKLLPAGPFLLGAQPEDAERLLDMLEAGDIEAATTAFPNPDAKE